MLSLRLMNAAYSVPEWTRICAVERFTDKRFFVAAHYFVTYYFVLQSKN